MRRALLTTLAILGVSSAVAQQVNLKQINGIGTGATNSPTMTDRVTDYGVTFNLKTDFGAKGDALTDDTTAIQAWLNKAAPNVHLLAPAGVYVFKTPLTTPDTNSFSIDGAGGPGATQFLYEGTSTTADLLTIGTAVAHVKDYFSGFSVVSNTVMTGGFAIHAHGMFDSVFSNVWTDTVNSIAPYVGRLCGGFWIDGAGGVDMIDPHGTSSLNCGDGIRVNEAVGASAELRIVGGDVGGRNVSGVIHGFANALHMAGGFGGLRCDETNFHNSGNGLLIDTAVTAIANREFNEGSTCAFDTMANNGVLVNDTLTSGGTVSLAGWVGSTVAGHGVNIESWPSGDVEIAGDKVYNNCGSGIYVQDATAYVALSSGTVIEGNGTTFGGNAACVAWQTANAGHGYGVEASSATTRISGNPLYVGNLVTGLTAGPATAFNGNSGLSQQSANSASGAQARFTVNEIGTGQSAVVAFAHNGTSQYTFGYNQSSGGLNITDVSTGSPLTALALLPGAGMPTLPPQTIAAVLAVTCNPAARGTYAYVSDTVASGAATFHGTVAGGGATTVNSMVSCNGSLWQYD